MLIAKYKKIGSACCVSHVDTLRTMGRIFARADMDIDFSEGFNPHMLVYFSPPNAVGVESLCEYVAVSAKDERDFVARFNKNAPHGFVAERVWKLSKNPNLAKEITAARYTFKANAFVGLDLDRLLSSSEFEIQYRDKDGVKTKDYRKYLLSAQKIDGGVEAVLRFGNENLRPDRFADGLRQFFRLPREDCEIIKTEVYVGEQTADEFLDKFDK